jgi:hypothetical protein
MKSFTPGSFICASLAALQLALSGCATTPSVPIGDLKVASDRVVGGFVNPESVAYDPKDKVLYAGNFGSPKLDPALKDGMGYISKVGLDGRIIEQRALPAAGSPAMHKPKGIWIQGDRLWVTDIDAVWIFDLRTKQSRRLFVPLGFANDPAVMGGALYVSDNRNDKMIKIEPADFLTDTPKVTEVFAGAGVNPNGVYPGRGGLLIGGFLSPQQARALYRLGADGKPQPISDPIGRLDGLYEDSQGSILSTDWNTGSLFLWTKAGGKKDLASGFKGPADFAVVPQGGGLLVVVPDLVQSHLRFIELKK